MTVREILPALKASLLFEADLNRPVRTVVACDLMSDVLVVDDDDILLLTSLASDQAVRTAQVVGAVAVVVVNGKPLPSSMADVARSLHVTLATSTMTKYEACVAVHAALHHTQP
jgi:hypothetical protein